MFKQFQNFGGAEIFGLFLIPGLSLNEADLSFQTISIPVKKQILPERHLQTRTLER